MTARQLARIVLSLTLALALVLPGIAASVQSVRMALATASRQAEVMPHAMPSDGMSMPAPSASADSKVPGNCGTHGCDLAACLGAGCLPTMPHIAAFIPVAGLVPTWEQPLPPSRQVETPLRPPIA
jgi:hypothetical protein